MTWFDRALGLFAGGALIVGLCAFAYGATYHHHRCPVETYWNGHQCALKCPPTGCW